MQPVAFKPETQPTESAEIPRVEVPTPPQIKKSEFTPAPMSKRAPLPPSKPNGITQVARPKFRATANSVRFIFNYHFIWLQTVLLVLGMADLSLFKFKLYKVLTIS